MEKQLTRNLGTAMAKGSPGRWERGHLEPEGAGSALPPSAVSRQSAAEAAFPGREVTGERRLPAAFGGVNPPVTSPLVALCTSNEAHSQLLQSEPPPRTCLWGLQEKGVTGPPPSQPLSRNRCPPRIHASHLLLPVRLSRAPRGSLPGVPQFSTNHSTGSRV